MGKWVRGRGLNEKRKWNSHDTNLAAVAAVASVAVTVNAKK